MLVTKKDLGNNQQILTFEGSKEEIKGIIDNL